MLRSIWNIVHAIAGVVILISGMVHGIWALYLDAFKHGQGMDHHLAWAGLCLAVSAIRASIRE